MSEIWQFIKDFFQKIADFFVNNGMEVFARAIFALILIFGGHFLIKLVIGLLKKSVKKNKIKVDKSVRYFIIDLFNFMLRFIWLVGILAVIGINITGITTIISSAILAVGLSLQDLIGNFASGVIILTNHPFGVDDYISIGSSEGTAKIIGMLSTTLATIDNQKVVIPNKTIIASNVVNYSENKLRRKMISLTFNYDQNPDEVKTSILKVFSSDNRVLANPKPNVVVGGISDQGYSITMWYWTRNSEFWDTYYDLMASLAKTFAKKNIHPAIQKLEVKQKEEN